MLEGAAPARPRGAALSGAAADARERHPRGQAPERRGRPWRTTVADPEALRRSDLVNRDFTAAGPGELLVTDFTYVRCWQGTVFFAFVLDVYSRRIVGWQFASHMRAQLVVDALQMALACQERVAHVELVHHSDKGSQYTSDELRAVLAEHDVLASVGSTGDATTTPWPSPSWTRSRPS